MTTELPPPSDTLPSDAPTLPAAGVRPLFEQAMDQTRMAMALSDPLLDDTPLIYVNQAFLDLTGYEREAVLGRNCRFLQGAGTDREAVARIGAAVRDETVVFEEIVNYRCDGTAFWNALHVGPIYDDAGRLRYHFASQSDVTEVRQVREAELAARILASGLASRLRTLFPVILDVVTMTSRHEGEPRFARLLNERIATLARAYEVTLSDGARQRTSLAPVVRAVLEPHADPLQDGGTPRVRISGEAVAMDPELVSLLGLVLHELAARAAHHGALSTPDGTVELSWAFDASRAFVMEWRENGRTRGRRTADTPPMLVDLIASAGGRITTRMRAQGYQARVSLPQGAWARETPTLATHG